MMTSYRAVVMGLIGVAVSVDMSAPPQINWDQVNFPMDPMEETDPETR